MISFGLYVIKAKPCLRHRQDKIAVYTLTDESGCICLDKLRIVYWGRYDVFELLLQGRLHIANI